MNQEAQRQAISQVAAQEGVQPHWLEEQVERGAAAVAMSRRGASVVAFGSGLRPKFCTIVGTSSAEPEPGPVVRKANAAIQLGASAIHDGSSAGDVDEIHGMFLNEVSVPLAFCHPISAVARAVRSGKPAVKIAPEQLLDDLEADAQAGAEILVLPIAASPKLAEDSLRRLMPSPNKSGALLVAWMLHNRAENPYAADFGRVLRIAKAYGVILSFVSAFRSGCISDALDGVQLAELREMKAFVRKAVSEGVCVKANTGGHIPADQVQCHYAWVKREVAAPIISFGPQVTDSALGYDHVNSAIGQALALLSGADAIFSITPSEHIGLPDLEEVKAGCAAARVVCHAVSVARGLEIEEDRAVSEARRHRDWQTQLSFALDAERVAEMRVRRSGEVCSMCGDLCAFRILDALSSRTKPVRTYAATSCGGD